MQSHVGILNQGLVWGPTATSGMEWRRTWTQGYQTIQKFRCERGCLDSRSIFNVELTGVGDCRHETEKSKVGKGMTWRIGIALTEIQRRQSSGLLTAVPENEKVQKKSSYANLFI